MEIKQINEKQRKKEIAAGILYQLPEWFGIPEATQKYIEDSADMPFFAAVVNESPVGFISIRENNPYTAEIYVLGVLKEYHKQGIGRALLHEVVDRVKERGFEYLEVKTLDGSHPDINYAGTRKFYLAMGFRPLECIPELWGKENPCLILVRHIG